LAIVKPFRGLRPKPDLAGKIAAPPYDVLSSDEARQIVKNNPISFLRVNKPEVDFPSDTPIYSKEVYQQGKRNLESLISSGKMSHDKSPCFYLHQLTWQGRSQTGLVALYSLDEYENGQIKKHERTRPDKVNDRAEHMMTVGGQVGPVMLAFRTQTDITKIFQELSSRKPDTDFESDGVRHKVWVVEKNSDIDNIQSAFSHVPHLYIADGHHRSESAAELRRRKKAANPGHTGKESYNYFLGEIFPSGQMRIMPYYRVISDFNGTNLQSLVSQAKVNFELKTSERPIQPEANNSFGLYSEGKWYNLEAKKGAFDPKSLTGSIGTAILEETFFKPILGITDVRKDSRVDFVGGIRGLSELERLVNSGKFKMAFSVCPVKIEQLLQIADAGEIMPPKSTWFEPKLKSGLIVHLFDK
jgi:uncharacterized protein (DUF1015 family)